MAQERCELVACTTKNQRAKYNNRRNNGSIFGLWPKKVGSVANFLGSNLKNYRPTSLPAPTVVTLGARPKSGTSMRKHTSNPAAAIAAASTKTHW